uniref:Uncharacterized protein n=1 Tax=Arundo donax TaxID=35708 RepID=A0A0A9AL44_ARUDO
MDMAWTPPPGTSPSRQNQNGSNKEEGESNQEP